MLEKTVTKNIRIIPRLDIKGPNVVKGIHLEGLRVVGRPELFAPYYYSEGADEIIYIDTVASLYGRNNLEEIVRRAAENIFIPLTVGGGIRSIDDIKRILRSGADKVAINTQAIKDPQFIRDAVSTFGSQSIVVSIQAKRRDRLHYECLMDNGRESTGIDVFEWSKRVADLGAGEILLTCVDKEGTGKGFDIELISTVSSLVDIPVIAAGGAGCARHVLEVISQGHIDAVCCASIFHYALIDYMAVKSEYSDGGNIEFLRRTLPSITHGRSGIEPNSITLLKKYLIASGINCRVL